MTNGNVTETCKECGTEYLVSYGHKDCPKKKQNGKEDLKREYLVTASAEIHGVTLGVEFRVWEKDDVKGGQIEAFHLCHSTLQELIKSEEK